MANNPGVVNKFQIPTNNPASLVGTGVVNVFTKNLQNSTKPLIQMPNAPVVYTTPGTYTFVVPASQTQPLNFVLLGGGGGGGGGYSTNGGGGGASGVGISGSVLFSPGSSITVIIGAGGSGGPPQESGNPGNPSSLSWDSIIVSANGGFSGGGGISGSSGLGGAGGGDGGAVPEFTNIESISRCNFTVSLSLGGYNAYNALGGANVMYVIPSGPGVGTYYSGSPPYMYIINGYIYFNAGGPGSTGGGSGTAGGSGLAIFYVNG